MVFESTKQKIRMGLKRWHYPGMPGNSAVLNKLPGKFNQTVSRPINKYLGQANVGARK